MSYAYIEPFNSTYLLGEVYSYPTTQCSCTKQKDLFYFPWSCD